MAIKSIVKEIIVDDYKLEIVINGDLSYNVNHNPPKARAPLDIGVNYPCVSTLRPHGHTSRSGRGGHRRQAPGRGDTVRGAGQEVLGAGVK